MNEWMNEWMNEKWNGFVTQSYFCKVTYHDRYLKRARRVTITILITQIRYMPMISQDIIVFRPMVELSTL